MAFWLLALGMTAVAVAFVATRLLRPDGAARWADPREASLAALRASWSELDRDREAGLLAAEQLGAAKDELARRADEELDAAPARTAPRPARLAAMVAVIAIPVAAGFLYASIGDPGAIEGVRAFEGFAAPLTPERLPVLRDQLARHLANHPGDGRSRALLARAELALDRFAESEAAFALAVADRKVALDPAIWCDYADAAGLAQGGRLEGAPARFIAKALALDPDHPRALEMAGSLAVERGDHAGAARHWQALLDRLGAEDGRRAPLARAIERVRGIAAREDMTKP
ncbi:MAG TPA: c-type cytochrome biogenesis protein CcmI [Usitatibacteraceae bacterium]|nr:c-type cytochrome biogenesis protein CcmI [Usitatibacteraceae bacterium]